MAKVSKKNWAEKSLEITKNTLNNLYEWTPNVAWEYFFADLISIAGAPVVLLLSNYREGKLSVLDSNQTVLSENLLDVGIANEWFVGENPKVIHQPFTLLGTNNLSLEVVLIIPLRSYQNTMLLLGFDKPQPDKKGLMNFAEITRSLSGKLSFTQFHDKGKNDPAPRVFVSDTPISEKNLRSGKDEITRIQKEHVLNESISKLPIVFFRIGSENHLMEIFGNGLDNWDLNRKYYLGKNAFDIFPELKNVIPFMEKGANKSVTIRKSTGDKRVAFECFIYKEVEDYDAIVGFMVDITAKELKKKELKRTKKLAERANLAKSLFLANQSHEIRTPINAILGFAQLIKNNTRPNESEEYLDFIISSGQNLLNILGNVLDLAKIEEGKLELVEESFNLQEIITSCLGPFQFQAKEKGLEYSLDFENCSPRYFLGDGGKINQIVINLVSNSIKFTETGKITVTVKCLTEAKEGEKTKVRIAVSDTGLGIAKNKLTKIFQNFTQADKTISGRFGGSGLGLSIVKELIQLMDGEFGVDSPGELSVGSSRVGSSFWVEFPLLVTYPPSSDINTALEDKEYNFHGLVNVLLVDDNYLNLRLASSMLKNLGCEVTIANNGQEALNEIEKKKFHLIFMDVQMPILNGYETTKRIRQDLKSNLPIIGLSASVYKEDIDQCFESGMDDYLGRPYSIKSFQEKVFKWAPKIDVNKDYQYHIEGKRHGKLTNLSYLEQIFGTDQEMILEIVQIYLENRSNMVLEIEEAVLKNDFGKVATIAHNIRSSIQSVGLVSLYELLIEIENNTKNTEKLPMLVGQLQKLKDICRKADLELKESLAIFSDKDF